MDLGLKGRVALVTGGSHGIGSAIAHTLSAEGCRVAICARRAQVLKETTESIRSTGGEAISFEADAMIGPDIERVMRGIVSTWGTIHILVNNVGGGGRWGNAVVEETPEEVWTEVFAKNALAAVRFTRLAIPYMRSQKWGRVVTIASIYGKEGGGRPWFAIAKSAEISLMKSLSLNHDLARDGITFNTVSPGGIMIPGTGWEDEQRRDPVGFRRMLEDKFPLGRMGTPDEVAAVVVFLCSESARQ